MKLLLGFSLDDVKKLLEMGVGDPSRLEHIKQTIEQNKTLYVSDIEFLEKLVRDHLRKTLESESKNPETNSQSKPVDEMNLEELENKIKTENESSDKKKFDTKKDLKTSLDKSGSWSRAFGRGVAGIFLFLFGLGMIFLLYHYFNNLDDFSRGMYYGVDPFVMIISFFVIIPLILIIIGGSSIYYGIRIIAKT